MKGYYKTLFYSSKSHYVLNHFTLTIQDAEIRHLYNEALGENFDKLFGTTAIIGIIFSLIRVVIYATGDLS
jgi:hypothetical protein